MTSISMAQPRPLPPSRAFTGPARHRSHASLPFGAQVSRGKDASIPDPDAHEGPPTKRRKIVSHGGSPVSTPVTDPTDLVIEPLQLTRRPKYVAADWQKVVTGQYKRPTPAEDGQQGPPPLPQPPWANHLVPEDSAPRERTSCRVRPVADVPNTPDFLGRNPPRAPLLDQTRRADYFPWTGKHAEDVINETNVKNGYCDRPPHPAERELNTAKAPLYNALKHRGGLDSLSALFTLVLEKKAKHDGFTSVSTFRPPPRVTLTEAKRRQWIIDLANPEYPLKRLSRTIPQGIRGLGLLEQCLQHKVPITRAIWFVRCVGANEIRTLKRKGVVPSVAAGAEQKWLREWTSNIEQFLDTIMAQCGEEEWTKSIRYAIDLAARMYQESLLERDHFLDHLVDNFASCTTQMVGAWFPLIDLFKIDLMRFRKRARKVAGAILGHCKDFFKMKALDTVLGKRLCAAVRNIATVRSAALVMSDRWLELKDTLRLCLAGSNSRLLRIVDSVVERNERLLGQSEDGESKTAMPSEVLKILDTVTAPFNINQLSSKLVEICPDYQLLCRRCLEWSTTRFRGQNFRSYLVVRLLRRWRQRCTQIDETVLEFFTSDHDISMLDMKAFRQVFAELSKSRSLSKSRLLQSLSVDAMSSADSNFTIKKQMLYDLVLDEDERLENLRDHLATKDGFKPSHESYDISQHLDLLRRLLDAAEHGITIDESLNVEVLSQLPWSARLKISVWLRQEALDLSKYSSIEIPGKPPLPGSRSLTVQQFLIIRNALEAMECLAVLADVLHCLSNTKQELVLASLVDCLNYNSDVFSAIGAFEALQKEYCRAYVNMRPIKPALLTFATALLDLCQEHPCQITPVKALQQDIIRGDRGRALAACSPFSNGVAESLQQATSTFSEDFEGILLAELNMAEQTMTSLFGVLVSRIMKSGDENAEQSQFVLCQLLARLRLLRPAQGDALIKKWLGRLFSAAWSNVHHSIALELLYTRCVCIDTLLELANQAPAASRCKQGTREILTNGLLANAAQGPRPQYAYVVQIAARRFAKSEPVRTLDILLSQNDRGPSMLEECVEILVRLLPDDNKLNALSPLACKSLVITIDQILDLQIAGSDALSHLLDRVNWLSLPFCAYRLPSLVGSNSTSGVEDNTDDKAKIIYERLQHSALSGSRSSETTKALLTSMPVTLQDQMRAMAERKFYDALPKCLQARAMNQSISITLEDKQKSAAALEELLALGLPRPGTTIESNMQLIEKLTIIAKLLGNKTESSNAPPSSPMSPAFQTHQVALPPAPETRTKETVISLIDFLTLFFRLAATKVHLFSSSLSKSMHNDRIKLVVLLTNFATQPHLMSLLTSNYDDWSKTKIRECVSFALDLAARMADDLSEQSRMACAWIMKDRTKDERVMWLFGSMATCPAVNNEAGHGLVMMHEIRGFVSEFRPKVWELLESGGGKEETCLGMGLFGARKV